MMSHVNQKGFTLIEAIVAMVIVSILSMSLYSWLSASYVSSNRAIKNLNKSDAVVSAKAYIERLNPMLQPEGAYQIGDYHILWSSQPITDIRPVYNGGTIGLFDVALYNVEVELFAGELGSATKKLGTYSVELIGYVRARDDIVQ